MHKTLALLRFGAAVLLSCALLDGCAHRPRVDYSAFKASRPRSILILPPLNESTDVKASYSMLSQLTLPLAEAGYYVMPVALVDETFKQNGMADAHDIQNTAPAKLKQIFGADAVLYVTVTQYGTQFLIVDSQTVVTAKARLVDLVSGKVLWTGTASANGNENHAQINGGGLVGVLVAAAVKQAINDSNDAAHPVAGITSARMMSGILRGPHSPRYGRD